MFKKVLFFCMLISISASAKAQYIDGAPGTFHGPIKISKNYGDHRPGYHDYDRPGRRGFLHSMSLNYGGYGGFDGFGGWLGRTSQPFYPSKPYYIPNGYQHLPVGTVHYFVDGFYEINADGYMYKESD